MIVAAQTPRAAPTPSSLHMCTGPAGGPGPQKIKPWDVEFCVDSRRGGGRCSAHLPGEAEPRTPGPTGAACCMCFCQQPRGLFLSHKVVAVLWSVGFAVECTHTTRSVCMWLWKVPCMLRPRLANTGPAAAEWHAHIPAALPAHSSSCGRPCLRPAAALGGRPLDGRRASAGHAQAAAPGGHAEDHAQGAQGVCVCLFLCVSVKCCWVASRHWVASRQSNSMQQRETTRVVWVCGQGED